MLLTHWLREGDFFFNFAFHVLQTLQPSPHPHPLWMFLTPFLALSLPSLYFLLFWFTHKFFLSFPSCSGNTTSKHSNSLTTRWCFKSFIIHHLYFSCLIYIFLTTSVISLVFKILMYAIFKHKSRNCSWHVRYKQFWFLLWQWPSSHSNRPDVCR